MRELTEIYRVDRDEARAHLAAAVRPVGELIATLSDAVDQPDDIRVAKARTMLEELHRAIGLSGSIDWSTGEVHRPPLVAEHTSPDREAFTAAGVDPASSQARERAVRCSTAGCGRMTWNQGGGCDRSGHFVQPAAVRRQAVA